MDSVSKTKKTNKKINNKTRKRKNMSKLPFPIDIVYTWKGEDKSNDIRLGYNHELKYSLRSVDLYAPWVNKIYILMNIKKTPSWIKENNKIIIVEHSDTFPSSKYLPNFNSNAIETTIANIKDLSEHYIYFNDDIFLGKKTKYTDFFTPSGKAIVNDLASNTQNILKNKNNNLLNIKFPPSFNRLYKHIPIPQIKSLVLEFNSKYSDYIHWIRKTKKRKERGFDVCEKYDLNSPCQQLHYPIAKYMYSKNKAKFVDNRKNTLYMSNAFVEFTDMLKDLLDNKKGRPLFLCINDVETDPKKRVDISKIMLSFLNSYYPKKASFEK
jgi:hypothetical protein